MTLTVGYLVCAAAKLPVHIEVTADLKMFLIQVLKRVYADEPFFLSH